ncbi:MAG: hypothetical protein NVS9B4_08590 [Candidatus Acidiferrum sp.]
MRYLCLACDYDGTIARDGVVSASTLAALQRVSASGRKVLLVTGRELDDLFRVFARVNIFDRVVAENGGVLYTPAIGDRRSLGAAPPESFVADLRQRGVDSLSVGDSIVATWRPFEHVVEEAIRASGLPLHVILNKDAVMILPTGVNKASGLRAALRELELPAESVVGVGDAENDEAFLEICGFSVAVGNALPSLKKRADFITTRTHGEGVQELIELLLKNDLKDF